MKNLISALAFMLNQAGEGMSSGKKTFKTEIKLQVIIQLFFFYSQESDVPETDSKNNEMTLYLPSTCHISQLII